MPQFFLPPSSVAKDQFSLQGPEAYHIAKVLRCREGETLELFDGHGGRYRGEIVRVLKEGRVEGRILETLAVPGDGGPVRLNLYQAILKGQRWDWLLEKATELGISCFVPVMTRNTIVVLNEDSKVGAKLDHWRKIILAASKQCGRADLPELRPPIPLRESLPEAKKSGLILFAWEKMSGTSAREALRQAVAAQAEKNPGKTIFNLFVGPEGGFTDEEVELAEINGATFFGLGPRTLRGETAALTAAGLILYELGAV